jgi:hypothetical protein
MAISLRPDSICSLCCKPFLAGTSPEPYAGGLVHVRCLVRRTQEQARENQATARDGIERARTIGDCARALIEEVRTLRGEPCPACGGSLANGRGILFQGEQLVHTSCWGESPPANTH